MDNQAAHQMEARIRTEKIIVAFTAYAWNHALVMLRIVRPLQQAGLKLIHGNELDKVYPERVSLADIVLIQRDFPRFTNEYQQVMARARLEGKPVVYEIDDLLLELPDEHPDRPIYYYTPALFPMLRAIVEADAVTTTTPALLAYLRPFNDHTYLLPNFLDDRLWSFRAPVEKDPQDPLVIGYMGSTSHRPDLEQILPVLMRLLEKYKHKVTLRFWGGEPPPQLMAFPNVEWIPMALPDYPKFVSEFSQQESDIFIAPLTDSFFNQCKSPIKFFEYSTLAVPGVYSKILPYQEVIFHGENGFLAGTNHEWENYLTELIESPALRIQMGVKAQQSVQGKWTLSQNAGLWKDFYNRAELCSQAGRERKQQQLGVVLRVSQEVQNWQEKLEAELREKEAELSEIKGSTAWRLVRLLWGIRMKLDPRAWRKQ
jgi:glycosyltransferase involved in cell wall biosynthesis